MWVAAPRNGGRIMEGVCYQGEKEEGMVSVSERVSAQLFL